MLDNTDHERLALRKDQDSFLSSLLSNPDNRVWELIFDSLPDMVALIDLNNNIVKANKAMLIKFKPGEKALVGHKCFNMMHQDGCARANCPHLSMKADSRQHSIELFEPKFNSYFHITTTPIFDTDNNLLGSLHIARDITIQKESEKKLEKYNFELQELNQSKDKFFSILAHDLRSPFQGMLGFTNFILDELDTLSKEDIREYLQKVLDSSYSTFSLLENLLNWSRMQTGKLQYNPSYFSINEEVGSVISLLFSNAYAKNISIENNINTKYNVHADQQMVHSMLLNLITNAIKFSFPGSKVTIDAKMVNRGESGSEEGEKVNRRGLEISVSDTGVGIPAGVLARLFKIDSQYSMPGTADEKGAGLGLVLVHEMAEKHGSKLLVKSEEQKGSIFTFILPLADE